MGVKRQKKKAAKQKGGMWGWKIRDKILQLGGGKRKKKCKKNTLARKLFFAKKM